MKFKHSKGPNGEWNPPGSGRKRGRPRKNEAPKFPEMKYGEFLEPNSDDPDGIADEEYQRR